MTDEELVAAFLGDELDPASFGHRDHVRLAWTLLGPGGLGFAEAYSALGRGLRALATRAGRAERYSETQTLGWLSLVFEAIEMTGERRDFSAFERAASDALAPRALFDLYGSARLNEPAARRGLLLPRHAGLV